MCDRSWTFTLLLSATLTLLVGVPSAAHAQDVFTVNSVGDDPDANAGDGTCATSSGDCTLRAAIQEANSNASGGDPDRIEFDIPGTASPPSPHVIQPGSALPQITDQVVIDGTTEPDYDTESLGDVKPVIEIDGANAGDNVDGFSFGSSGDGSVLGLSIINFDGAGDVDGGAAIRGNDFLDIEGCHLGVRADGSTVAANDRGIVLSGSGNTIGGFSAESNIIGGNDLQGIVVEGADNSITGDFIGTNPNGDDLGNGSGGSGSGEGIRLAGEDSELARNVVAFSAGAGITVATGATDYDMNENTTFSNGGLGIDLGGDGRTANDSGDGDDGANRLQNFPEIQSAEFTSNGDVEVTYTVPSDPDVSGSGASTYPLRVEFFKASADGEGGRFVLTDDTYSAGTGDNDDDYGGCGSPPCPVTITFTPPQFVNLSETDRLVATATDAEGNGNTSEFSPASSQLPVELAGFDAQLNGEESVRLTWQTASETGNAGFEIQRKQADASSATWQTVGSREGAGTTSEPQRYRFTDATLPFEADRLAYRLKQVDTDGTASYSEEVTVRRGVDELTLLGTTPNPARQRATVRFAVPERQEVTVRLYDVLGRRVRTTVRRTAEGRQETMLDVGNLSSGVYVLRLRAGDQTRTRKLTVVR